MDDLKNDRKENIIMGFLLCIVCVCVSSVLIIYYLQEEPHKKMDFFGDLSYVSNFIQVPYSFTIKSNCSWKGLYFKNTGETYINGTGDFSLNTTDLGGFLVYAYKINETGYLTIEGYSEGKLLGNKSTTEEFGMVRLYFINPFYQALPLIILCLPILNLNLLK